MDVQKNIAQQCKAFGRKWARILNLTKSFHSTQNINILVWNMHTDIFARFFLNIIEFTLFSTHSIPFHSKLLTKLKASARFACLLWLWYGELCLCKSSSLKRFGWLCWMFINSNKTCIVLLWPWSFWLQIGNGLVWEKV